MSLRKLLAGFAKSVLVHRHAFVPGLSETLAIGRKARMPESFARACGAPAPGALDRAIAARRWGAARAQAQAWARRETGRWEAPVADALLRMWRGPVPARAPLLEGLIERCAAPEAMRRLEKAAARFSGEPAPALWLALALLRRVELGRARRVLDALCAREPGWSWPLLARSELERVDIRYEPALADADAAAALDPRNAWIPAFRARVLFQKERGPAGLPDMNRAIALSPREGWLYAWRGDARRKLGDARGAEADLRAALALEPYDRVYLWLGKLLRARGDERGAERVLTRGLRACPHFEKARAERARGRLAQGKVRLALEDLEAAVRVNHRHNSFWNWTAEIEPLSEERRRVLERLSAHARARPRSARARAWLGEALVQAGFAAEGLRALDAALALAPGLPLARTWRGEALLRLRRFEEAEAELGRALRADPADGRARAFRGRARFLLGRPESAAEDLALAGSDSMIEYSWIYYWRAQARLESGARALALEDARTAVQLEPGREEFRRLLERAEGQAA